MSYISPTAETRNALSIALDAYKADPSPANLARLEAAAEGYSGQAEASGLVPEGPSRAERFYRARVRLFAPV